MIITTRDPEAVQAEIKRLLGVIAEERATVLGELEALTAAVLSADRADATARDDDRDTHCQSLLDLAYNVLGDTGEVELLCALLGYEEPDE